ncbi:MAG: methylmalonyl-CoA mutase [Elusimicrobia bacterium]|nr:methylmalonyl-CoA mutase [Elusimicrobiota bacterium]
MSVETQEAPQFVTSSGIEVKRVYGPSAGGPDTGDGAYAARQLGRAGEPPYTRGIHKTMYRRRLWTMRQYAGFGTASETNARFRWLLSQGQTGLSTAFDLPTQIGLDADSPRARGEVGRVGVHVGTLGDMERLFDAIPLEEVSTSLTINATAPVLLAFYAAVAKKRKIPPERLRGTLQNDVLKEFLARGTYIFPPGPSLRLAVDTIEHATRRFAGFHPISISGYHIREAGATAVQELAFTFGNAEVYIRALLERGLSIDTFGPRLAFFFGCHNHFLEEIAKFRAARRLWHRVMKEEYGARDPKTLGLKFHVQTCGSTLTNQQPLNNAIRVSIQAMAAALGGAQSLHTNSYDEALALPTEESAELALRTQQVLACETGVPDAVDPVGGAYAVEALTDEIEARAWDRLKKVREAGGMLALIEQGIAQAEIQEAAYRAQREVETGRRKIVGVNCFQSEGKGTPRPTLKISPKIETQQKRRLAAFRRGRSAPRVQRAVRALRSAAASPRENIFPLILAGVEAGATIGEICDTLREVFTEYHGR